MRPAFRALPTQSGRPILNLLLTNVQALRFEIIPHPRYRGDWLLKPTRGAPFGLWYRERAHAVSYAEWVAREVDCAEIIVRNRDGTLAERRFIQRALPARNFKS